MRVSIDHKEERTGLIRKTTHYVVYCKVDFSEEEKQIIKQRNLGDWKVMDRELDSMSHDPKELAKLGITNSNLHIRDLMKKEPNKYACSTPAEAKDYDERLKEALKMIKQFIANNAEIEQKSTTFEL